MLFGLIGAAILAGAGVFRTMQFRRMTALTMRHRTIGPDGIVVGGEGFELHRPGAPAVLLLHGGGDTPQTLRYLADALYQRGYHVRAPLLPGHGRSLRDFARLTADDLTAAAEQNYMSLRSSHAWVAVVGLSMGGALAVQLAADHHDLSCLGLLAPYLAMPNRIERWARTWWLWGLFLPAANAADGVSILDAKEVEKNLAYGAFTPRALRALQQTVQRAVKVLPRVAAPTLVIQSTQDNRISMASAEHAFTLLGSREKHIEWVSGAAHVITVDFGRDRVIDQMVSFIERVRTAQAPSHSHLENSNR